MGMATLMAPMMMIIMVTAMEMPIYAVCWLLVLPQFPLKSLGFPFSGLFLHVLADTMGSVGVIISSILIQLFGWHASDPIVSILIAVLILASVAPFISSTACILLSAVPEDSAVPLYSALAQAANLPGVAQIHDPHFWETSRGALVGTVNVQV